MQPTQQQSFPADLSHLVGKPVPSVILQASDGSGVDLSQITGKSVVFIHPGSSKAIQPVEGWVEQIMQIPGAAGCTGQCQAFAEQYESFSGVNLYGLSGQTAEELNSVVGVLGLPYQMLSDTERDFLDALGLRSIRYAAPDGSGAQAYHPRVTLILDNGVIEYAVVPEQTPDGAKADAQEILNALL